MHANTNKFSQVNRLKKPLIPAENGGNNFHRHSSLLTRDNTDDLATIFPCNNPCTPSMVELNKRLMTYVAWPHHIKATPRELAEAGFVYLGNKDRTKCFYCNGGLQHWKEDEEPWFEHAKWYPNCEYVLRKRGIEYVQRIASQFPDLKRPLMPNRQNRKRQPITTSPPVSTGSLASNQSNASGNLNHKPTLHHTPATSGACSSEYNSFLKTKSNGFSNLNSAISSGYYSGSSSQSQIKCDEMPIASSNPVTSSVYLSGQGSFSTLRRDEIPSTSSNPIEPAKKTLSDLMNSDIVTEALNCVVNKDLIQKLVIKKYEDNLEYTSVYDLVSDSLEEENNSSESDLGMETDESEGKNTYILQSELNSPSSMFSFNSSEQLSPEMEIEPSSTLSDDIDITSHGVKEKIEDLMNEQRCKICLDKEINCVFTPCGHACCCLDCGPGLNKCPICRKNLEKIIKFYR